MALAIFIGICLLAAIGVAVHGIRAKQRATFRDPTRYGK